MPPGQFAVDGRVRVHPLLGPAGNLAGYPGRYAHRDHAVGHGHPRRHRGTRRDQGAVADDDAVQDRGAVAHQRFGADDGAVHHAQVADGGALADLGHRVITAVQHRTVLDVRAAPDHDRAEVGPEHSAVPDGGFGLDPDVPDQGGGGGDPGRRADLRLTAFEGEKWHPPMMHPGPAAARPGRTGYACGCEMLTSQEMPNLSTHMPNSSPQTCFCSGISVTPPAASCSK